VAQRGKSSRARAPRLLGQRGGRCSVQQVTSVQLGSSHGACCCGHACIQRHTEPDSPVFAITTISLAGSRLWRLLIIARRTYQQPHRTVDMATLFLHCHLLCCNSRDCHGQCAAAINTLPAKWILYLLGPVLPAVPYATSHRGLAYNFEAERSVLCL
jgi:hypothetical protein